MDDADVAEEFPNATLDRMVREVRPAWSLREAAAADEGTDAVFFLGVETPAGPRECVLKACEFLDPVAFRPEPHLLGMVGRRTSVPVPQVLGAVDDHDSLPAPYFLMERREGEVRENEAGDLPADAMDRLAHDAGRNLGELHGLGDFDRFGPVRLARDVNHSRVGVEGPDVTLVVGDEGVDSWRVRFEEFVDFTVENLDARFADLEAPLRSSIEAHLDALDRGFPVVFGHDDYRLGNLLVEPGSGETRAVLDWGNANTLEAQYNLVLTEQYLSGWALHDDPRRERVRAALREGYEESGRDIERDPDVERRRDLYLAATRMFPLAWFSLWYRDFPEAEREEIAAKHRRAVRELLQ